jgi:large subunit ribosomal protein L13
MHQTTFAQPAAIQRRWHITSAKGQVLGKLAVRIANALSGRDKATWSPAVDAGAFVVVTDAEAVVLTGKKETDKTYRFHSGYMGGITEINVATMRASHPERIIELAVKRMLAKTVQGRHQLKRLKVYKGSAHPHAGAKPAPL